MVTSRFIEASNVFNDLKAPTPSGSEVSLFSDRSRTLSCTAEARKESFISIDSNLLRPSISVCNIVEQGKYKRSPVSKFSRTDKLLRRVRRAIEAGKADKELLDRSSVSREPPIPLQNASGISVNRLELRSKERSWLCTAHLLEASRSGFGSDEGL